MSTITIDTTATVPDLDQYRVTPGRVIVATLPDNRAAWFYVVAVLAHDPDRDVATIYGVPITTGSYTTSRESNPSDLDLPPFSMATVALGYVSSVTLGDVHESRRAALVETFRGITPTATTSGEEETSQEAYARGVNDATREAEARFESWKVNATAVAHTYADNNELCSEFDRCMEEIGLPSREREYLVTYRVTLGRGDDPWNMDPEDIWDATGGDIGHPTEVQPV